MASQMRVRLEGVWAQVTLFLVEVVVVVTWRVFVGEGGGEVEAAEVWLEVRVARLRGELVVVGAGEAVAFSSKSTGWLRVATMFATRSLWCRGMRGVLGDKCWQCA